MSIGNQPIEINLSEHKTTLISGTNGSGKSTMIEAIAFCLYGKSFRKINKPQLVNSINQKDLLVELEFDIGGANYLIKRGIKPNIFEIWKNGELLNKDAAARDYQQYLEQNILKMSFKSFSQIVILGSATYVPFMELPTGQRREIIEDLLDIQVFSTMNILLKDRINENKKSIQSNEHKIELVQTQITSAKEHNEEIQKLKQVEVDKIKSKILENVKIIELEKEKIEKYDSEIADLSGDVFDKQKHKASRDKFKNLLGELSRKKNEYSTEITFYHDHDHCPECKQNIDHDFKSNLIAGHTEKTEEINGAILKLTDKLKAIDDKLEVISDIEDKILSLVNKSNEHKLNVKLISKQIKTLGGELENAKKDVDSIDQEKIKEYEKTLREYQDEQTDLYSKRETLGVISSMLKDSGIKAKIIQTYIPIMNKLINQYLAEFELFVDFNLDDNFNETIKSRFRDAFSFASFSEGEKMRISLSILFTWRAVAKLRNSVSTNLLIMDEVLDSASDAQGIESLIDILKKMNKNDNILVISHRGESFQDRFDNHIQFSKVKNFTEIVN